MKSRKIGPGSFSPLLICSIFLNFFCRAAVNDNMMDLSFHGCWASQALGPGLQQNKN